MTNHLVSEPLSSQPVTAQAASMTSAVVSANSLSRSNQSLAELVEPKKLPYQANQQAEFLCLQAETEALLSQLQTLKQRRLAVSHATKDA